VPRQWSARAYAEVAAVSNAEAGRASATDPYGIDYGFDDPWVREPPRQREARPPLDPRQLGRQIVPDRVPHLERMRRYFGRGISPELIEQVLYMATQGYMRDLTDLVAESIATDPHLGSVIGKRFRAIMSIEPQFVAASGPGIDTARANAICQQVRDSVTRIPRMRRTLLQMAWARCNGRAAHELHWKERPGARNSGDLVWSVEGFGWLHPRRLSFGPEREIRIRDGLWQGYGFQPIGFDVREIPGKFMITLPQLFNEYPEREGFGPRALYWSFFKRFGWRERMVLLEIFGKPWRYLGFDSAWQNISVDTDRIEQAQAEADAMGSNSTAVIPKGMKLGIEQPGDAAGEAHRNVNDDVNAEISKLVLGQTRTTDAEPGALGSDGDQVAQDSESLVIATDAFEISDDLTEQLIRPIVQLNFGEEMIPYAPRMELKYALPPPRGEQIDNTNKALQTGLPLRRSQVYERIGFDEPAEGDETITAPAPAPGVPGAGGLFSSGAAAAAPLAEVRRQLSSLTRQVRILREHASSRR